MSWSAHHITYTYPHDHRITYTLITSHHRLIFTISASYIRSPHYIIHLSSRPAYHTYAHHITSYTYPHDQRITYTLITSHHTVILTTSASHIRSSYHIISYTYPHDQRITYTLITLYHILILTTSALYIRSSHYIIHLSLRPTHHIYAHHITSYTYPHDQRITYTLITSHHTLILTTSKTLVVNVKPSINCCLSIILFFVK